MRTPLCYLEFICNIIPQNSIPLFLSDFVNVYQSTHLKIRPQQTQEMKLTQLDREGQFSLLLPCLLLPENKFDTQCPSAPAGWLPRGPPCLL